MVKRSFHIYLGEKRTQAAKEIARKMDISVSEFVRRAIDVYISNRPNSSEYHHSPVINEEGG
jgi:hypothetical protein